MVEAQHHRGLAPSEAAITKANAERTVEDLFTEWIEVKKRTRRQSTVEAYQFSIDAYSARIGSVRLPKLKAKDLDDLYAQWLAGDGDTGPVAATTIRNRHNALNGALRQAYRWDWIEANPAAKATPTGRAQADR